jgi:hypothetical protein
MPPVPRWIRDPIDKLLRFFQPYYKLNPKRWKPVHARPTGRP